MVRAGGEAPEMTSPLGVPTDEELGKIAESVYFKKDAYTVSRISDALKQVRDRIAAAKDEENAKLEEQISKLKQITFDNDKQYLSISRDYQEALSRIASLEHELKATRAATDKWLGVSGVQNIRHMCPNLAALADGRVSGKINEWPLKHEMRVLFEALRRAAKEAEK